MTDDGRRTPSDGKSSHCLWQGELKKLNIWNLPLLGHFYFKKDNNAMHFSERDFPRVFISHQGTCTVNSVLFCILYVSRNTGKIICCN